MRLEAATEYRFGFLNINFENGNEVRLPSTEMAANFTQLNDCFNEMITFVKLYIRTRKDKKRSREQLR